MPVEVFACRGCPKAFDTEKGLNIHLGVSKSCPLSKKYEGGGGGVHLHTSSTAAKRLVGAVGTADAAFGLVVPQPTTANTTPSERVAPSSLSARAVAAASAPMLDSPPAAPLCAPPPCEKEAVLPLGGGATNGAATIAVGGSASSGSYALGPRYYALAVRSDDAVAPMSITPPYCDDGWPLLGNHDDGATEAGEAERAICRSGRDDSMVELLRTNRDRFVEQQVQRFLSFGAQRPIKVHDERACSGQKRAKAASCSSAASASAPGSGCATLTLTAVGGTAIPLIVDAAYAIRVGDSLARGGATSRLPVDSGADADNGGLHQVTTVKTICDDSSNNDTTTTAVRCGRIPVASRDGSAKETDNAGNCSSGGKVFPARHTYGLRGDGKTPLYGADWGVTAVVSITLVLVGGGGGASAKGNGGVGGAIDWSAFPEGSHEGPLCLPTIPSAVLPSSSSAPSPTSLPSSACCSLFYDVINTKALRMEAVGSKYLASKQHKTRKSAAHKLSVAVVDRVFNSNASATSGGGGSGGILHNQYLLKLIREVINCDANLRAKEEDGNKVNDRVGEVLIEMLMDGALPYEGGCVAMVGVPNTALPAASSTATRKAKDGTACCEPKTVAFTPSRVRALLEAKLKQMWNFLTFIDSLNPPLTATANGGGGGGVSYPKGLTAAHIAVMNIKRREVMRMLVRVQCLIENTVTGAAGKNVASATSSSNAVKFHYQRSRVPSESFPECYPLHRKLVGGRSICHAEAAAGRNANGSSVPTSIAASASSSHAPQAAAVEANGFYDAGNQCFYCNACWSGLFGQREHRNGCGGGTDASPHGGAFVLRTFQHVVRAHRSSYPRGSAALSVPMSAPFCANSHASSSSSRGGGGCRGGAAPQHSAASHHHSGRHHSHQQSPSYYRSASNNHHRQGPPPHHQGARQQQQQQQQGSSRPGSRSGSGGYGHGGSGGNGGVATVVMTSLSPAGGAHDVPAGSKPSGSDGGHHAFNTPAVDYNGYSNDRYGGGGGGRGAVAAGSDWSNQKRSKASY